MIRASNTNTSEDTQMSSLERSTLRFSALNRQNSWFLTTSVKLSWCCWGGGGVVFGGVVVFVSGVSGVVVSGVFCAFFRDQYE